MLHTLSSFSTPVETSVFLVQNGNMSNDRAVAGFTQRYGFQEKIECFASVSTGRTKHRGRHLGQGPFLAHKDLARSQIDVL